MKQAYLLALLITLTVASPVYRISPPVRQHVVSPSIEALVCWPSSSSSSSRPHTPLVQTASFKHSRSSFIKQETVGSVPVCFAAIETALANITLLGNEIMFASCGQSIGSIGNVLQCTMAPSASFFYVVIEISSTETVYNGICAPNVCNSSDIFTLAPLILEGLTQTVIPASMIIEAVQVAQETVHTPGAYAALVILSLFGVVVITATALHIHQKTQAKPRQYHDT